MSTATAKVLLVEDEPLILFTLADHLRQVGLEVVEALDASQALEALAKHPGLAAMVTDVNMPGPINGLELTRIVNFHFPSLPVVVSSGQATKDEIPRGAIFVPKPYRYEDMSKLIKQLVSPE